MPTPPNRIDVTERTAAAVLRWCAVLFVVMSCFVVVFKRTDIFPWIGDCVPNIKTDRFMAYCHSVRYGDYEHFAYYHASEPEAIEHLRTAKVLFLGSSNTQFAFSTKAVQKFFTALGVKHYVFGFGHGAQSGVAEAMITRHNLSPRVVVINADPFFTGAYNDTFVRVLEGGDERNESWQVLPAWMRPTVHGEHRRKRELQALQQQRCSATNGSDLWCSGNVDTLYRIAENGHWQVDFYRENLRIPVSIDKESHIIDLAAYAKVAQSFIGAIGVTKSCVVLTVSPRRDAPVAYAKALANQLGVQWVAPQLNDLHTIDGSHLDPDSSERWSAAFVDEIDETVRSCLL